MKRGRTPIILLFIIVVSTLSVAAQNNFSVKYFGLTIHPFGDYTADIQPYKLDKNAYFVANFGGYASYEHFIWYDIFSLRIKQGLFTDCSGGLMGVSHLGIQAKTIENEKHRLSLCLGPALIYRESWRRFPQYKPSNFWHNYYSPKTDSIQYKAIIYGCEFEYDYTISPKADLSVNFIPGFPFAFTLSVGFKYWFNKDFNKRVKFVVPKKNKHKEPHNG